MTVPIKNSTLSVDQRYSMDTMTLINSDEPCVRISYSKVIDNERIPQPELMIPMSQFPNAIDSIDPLTGQTITAGGITPQSVYVIIFSLFKDMMDNPSSYEDTPIIEGS